MDYDKFLESKSFNVKSVGINKRVSINPKLFDFQKHIVKWALKRGRAAVFADCGLGKTPIQLEWAKHIPGNILICAPLAVSQQTVREGKKFNIEVKYCRHAEDIDGKITITNYEMLHKFDPRHFAGLVLDESSILKSFGGIYRRDLIAFAKHIPYRLACTATPAPNDLIELSNHAEFLDIMTHKEIMALFFRLDGNDAHNWILKGHARSDFWRWMASWSVALRDPSDLGYDDKRFKLPPLKLHEHTVKIDTPDPGMLFALEAKTLEERRRARSNSTEDRVKMLSKIINGNKEQWLVWCNLNKESDMATHAIKGAVEVKGSDSIEHKESTLLGFANGDIQCLVTKPSIACHGLNLQACSNMAFLGLSDCYDERTEVLTRRGWHLFGDITTDDLIGTVNPETMAMEWQSPSRIIWEPYCGKMYHFQGQRSFDLLVTPNHKLFVKRCSIRYRKHGEWELKRADSIVERFMRQKYRMINAPKSSTGNYPSIIDIPDYGRKSSRSRTVLKMNSEDFMRLAGWYISEGYCRPMDSRESGRIAICQSDKNPGHRKEIIDLMLRIGLNVNRKTKDITGYSVNLAKYLIDQFGSGSYYKKIPRWVKDMHPDLLIILRDTMMKGDGAKTGHYYKSFSTDLLDDFQEICLCTGIRASVHRDYVSLAWKNLEPSIHSRPMTINYNGMIGCVTVPNHTIIVRRNGIPVVSGNSYEQFYQALRRCWRFGQKSQVDAHIIVANTEGAVRRNIERKEKQAMEMMNEITSHMKDIQGGRAKHTEADYEEDEKQGNGWTMKLGDSVKRIKEIEDDTVGLSVFSPPFPGMYAYTNSRRDMGNVGSIESLLNHFEFLVDEMYRITMPGRSCCIHLTQEPIFKRNEGYSGLRDFRGDIIKLMQTHDWIFASERTIDKDPQLKAQRTKDIGLAMKTAAKDSSVLTGTMPDYLLQFKKRGDNPIPIKALIDHPKDKMKNKGGWITREDWIQWASAVWYGVHRIGKGGISESDVLSCRPDKDEDDEKHLCPLQLGVIERCVKLWSAPGDLVFSPFAGIGSEGYQAIKFGRKFIGIELKRIYWKSSCRNLRNAERFQKTLFCNSTNEAKS